MVENTDYMNNFIILADESTLFKFRCFKDDSTYTVYAIDWIEKKGIKYYVFAHFYDWHPDDNQC